MQFYRQIFKTFFVLLSALVLISCGDGSDTSRLSGGITLSSSTTTLNVGGSGYSTLKAKVVKDDGSTLASADVVFETTIGSFDASSSLKTKIVRTDILGQAEVKLYAGSSAGTGTVYASSGGYNASTSVNVNKNSSLASVQLYSSASSLNVGSTNYALLTAYLVDDNGNAVVGAPMFFQTNVGSFNSTSPSLSTTTSTDVTGKASIILYPGTVSGTATVYASALGYNAFSTVVINPSINGDNSLKLGAITLVPVNTTLTADGTSVVALDITTYDNSATGTTVLSNVSFTTTSNAGLLSATATDFSTATNSLTATTDTNGQARIYLQSSTQATSANVIATSNGVSANTSIAFVAGSPSVTRSTLTPSPSSLAADGLGTSVVTAVLLDANGNLVADGTTVTLQTTAGTINTTNPTTTSLGRATFTLLAPSTAATATLSILQYPAITSSVTFGSVTNANPANLTFSVANPQLYVFGVGKQDTTSLTISVKTASGNLIDDADAGVNNLKVTFKSRPNAGEKLIGKDATGAVIETSTSVSTIAVRTESGIATLTLQSGTLPGVVEIEAEALLPDGSSLSNQLIGVVPQVSIASGPPHSINLSYPVASAVENLGNGVYRRVGSAFVTDRFGNAVPDGTVISLGVLDSVVVSNSATGYAVNMDVAADNNASFTAASNVLTDNTNSPFLATITRNGTSRGLQTHDRVLLLNAQSEDKSRFINSLTANTLTANKNYQSTSINTGLTYVAGASLLGAQIEGVNEAKGTTVVGQATTKDGYATFYLRYPADNEHILTGCYSDPTLDIRATAAPAGSAQVWVVAESSETGATTVDNRACFSAILDYELINNSGIDAISNSATIGFTIRDANEIPLPFVNLSAGVSIDTNTGGLGVSVGNCTGRTDRRTTEGGTCSLPITVTGGASGDAATVTIGAGGNAHPVTISVSIP